MQEEYFRTLLDNLPEGVSIIDRNMRIEWVNKALRNKGFDIEAVKGKPCHIIYKNRESICEGCPAAEAFRTGREVRVIERGSDGKKYEVTAVPISDNGEVVRVMEFVKEYTPSSERTPQDAINLAEKRFMEFVDDIEDMAFIINREHKVVSLNKKAASFLRQKKKKVIGKSVFELFPRQIAEKYAREIDQVFSSGKPFSSESHTFIGEEKRWLRTTINPVKDAEGKVSHVVGISVDTTEKKNAEEALKESEHKYRTFVENFHGIAYKAYMNGTPIFFHGSVKEITGYSEKDFVEGKPVWTNIILPEDFKRIKDSWTKVATVKNFRTSREYRIVRKDNKIRWVHDHVRNVCLDGKPEYVQGTIHDITEKKNTEELLQEQKRDYQTIFDSSPSIIIYKSKEDRILNVNKTYSDFLGLPKNNIIGKTTFDVVKPKELAEKTRADDLEVIKSGKPKLNFIRRYVSPFSKKEIWGLISKLPFYDKEKKIIGTITFLEDITERKEAEEALKESEKLYHSLFSNMLNGFAYCKMIFRRGKPEDFIYLDVNKSFGTLTGLKNVVGKKVSEVIPGIQKSDPQLFKIYGRVSLTGRPERFEIYVESLKMWFWISVYCPQKGYFVAVFDVITERKKAEEQIKRSYQELREIDQMKSTLLRDASHELRTPAAMMAMATDFLGNELKEEIPSKKNIEKYLEMLQRNSKKLRDQTSLVVEFSRLESLKQLDTGKINLCRTITDVTNAFKGKAAEKGIKLAFKPARESFIYANANLISILLENLLGNAIKFTKRGHVYIRCRKKDGKVFIEVEDTGIGMKPEGIRKIFKPFSQLNLDIEGLGLGLALCKKIVELHNGEIKVRSAPRKGSTFTVVLPVRRRSVAPPDMPNPIEDIKPDEVRFWRRRI
ncbi:MAG TPA: PAS domain S-box protein [Candidatus Nanoarchaeia archaeon]|nr:PAS domain S-box protein [Candidatus Nanoarchaeia archaeon]